MGFRRKMGNKESKRNFRNGTKSHPRNHGMALRGGHRI